MSVQTEIARIAQAKTDIKNVVNSKVANTITNQTIDAFPPLIDSSIAAYKNLIPWIEGSGSSFTIDNAEAGKLDKFEMYGNTHQDSYTGKNLMDSEWQDRTLNGVTITNNGDGTYTLNGTSTSSSAFSLRSIAGGSAKHTLIGKIANNVGKYITISTGYSTNQNFYLQLNLSKRASGAEQYGFVSSVKSYTNKLISSNESDVVYMNFFLGINANASFNNLKIYPMITIQDSQITTSPTPSDFEPYVGGTPSPNPDYPQDVRVVTGEQDIEVSGKNKFNPSEIIKSALATVSNDTITIDDNSGWGQGYIICGSKIKAGTYTFSSIENNDTIRILIRGYKNDELYTNAITATGLINPVYSSYYGATAYNAINDVATFTLPDTCDYYYMGVGLGRNGSQTFKVQVEKDSTATTYEPYQSQTYPINLGVENLFDKDNTTILNAYIDTNIIDTSAKAKTTYIPCKPNTTYTIQKRNDGNNNRFTTATTTVLPAINVSVSQYNNNNSASTMTITTNSTANYLCLTFYHIDETTLTQQQVLDSIQIEKGSKASPYTPYGTTPIELCKIGSYQDEIRKSTGKNLFDKNNANIINAYLDSNTSKIVSNNANRTFYINCEENTTYTISKMQTSTFSVAYTKVLPQDNVEIFGFNSTATTLSDGRKTITITTGSGANYIVCRFMQTAQDTATLSQILSTIMVEKSSSATSYEPYGKVWYKHSEIGKVVLDGSEANWDTFARVNYEYQLLLTNQYGGSGYDYLSSYSNRYKNHNTTGVNLSNYEYSCFVQGTDLYVRFRHNDITTLEAYKTWLSTHNTIVYYILATPTYETITNETLINQLEAIETHTGTNVFEASNENNVLPDLYVLTEKQDSYKN